VLAVNLHGHMGGPRLPDGFSHTIEASADLAEAELDAAGLKHVHIAGNSLGGWIAIELARRGRARSVVALAPGGGWEAGSAQQKRVKGVFTKIRASLRVGGPLAPVLSQFAASRRFALGSIVARPELLTPQQARMIIEASWRCDAFDGVLGAVEREPPPRPIDGVHCPIRLVWGTRDRVLPMRGYSERWRRILPAAGWVELHGAGHVPMFDDPEAVVRAILEVTAPESELPTSEEERAVAE
jgi:pimeloyl-ACP methyl ester carboxylesterase